VYTHALEWTWQYLISLIAGYPIYLESRYKVTLIGRLTEISVLQPVSASAICCFYHDHSPKYGRRTPSRMRRGVQRRRHPLSVGTRTTHADTISEYVELQNRAAYIHTPTVDPFIHLARAAVSPIRCPCPSIILARSVDQLRRIGSPYFTNELCVVCWHVFTIWCKGRLGKEEWINGEATFVGLHSGRG